jgi:hypothetical protein
MRLIPIALCLLVLLPGRGAAAHPEGKKSPDKREQKMDVNNPIRKISGMMEKAGKLLDRLETGKPTQEEQKKILGELDRLIELAQKASSSSSSSQRRQQNQSGEPKNSAQPDNSARDGASPMPDSRDVYRVFRPRLGEGAPDLREMWGKLPGAERDEILQLLKEKLPLKYKQLLYLYYRALSEEQ